MAVELSWIREHLEERGHLEEARCLDGAGLRGLRERQREVVGAIRGSLRVLDTSVTVTLAFPRRFPRALPVVYLEPWDALGFLPHVDLRGTVCYRDSEGVLLDHRSPEGIAEEALQMARALLEDGVQGKNHEDFLDEFEAYWVQLEGLRSITSFIEPHSVVRSILLARDAENSSLYLAEDQTSMQAFYRSAPLKPVTYRNALFVPLKPDGVLRPPKPPAMWSVDEIRRLVRAHVPIEQRRELERLARKLDKADEFVVLGIPRPGGGKTLVGLSYHGTDRRHPLLEGGGARQVIPVQLHRKDRSFVLPRGGANEKLAAKRVLLVGCGSIGGFLAFALTRAGVLNLTLVDPQRLGTENIFRHRLGMRYVGQHKSEAVQKELEETLSYVSISSHVGTVEELVSDGRLDLAEFELVITALGLPNVERWLNETMHTTSGAPPLIVTWLEPYGIGGHALLTRPPLDSSGGGEGCLECLFIADGPEGLRNRASFAEPGQTFAQNVTGCGSLYTPFGAMDALRTAELAGRLAIGVLEGREPGSRLLSWKGDAADFLAAEFRLAPRFDLDEADLKRTGNDFANPTCAVCQAGVT
jgi:hypothetical protein